MKGPGLRIDLDVRRLWKCPKCGRQVRLGGDVSSRVCHCQKDGTFMQLVELPKISIPSAERPVSIPTPAPTELLTAEIENEFGSGLSPGPGSASTPQSDQESDLSQPGVEPG